MVDYTPVDTMGNMYTYSSVSYNLKLCFKKKHFNLINNINIIDMYGVL